jgi:hypothetical protein
MNSNNITNMKVSAGYLKMDGTVDGNKVIFTSDKTE